MPYRFVIMGCGKIARRHAEAIIHTGQLTGVCDSVPAKALELANDFGTTAYDSLELMIESGNPDFVVICTPNGSHITHVTEALRSGCNVLCEKPLTISIDDALKLFQEVITSGKKLFVVKQNRFNPPVLFVKNLLNQSKLGFIHSFQINCFWNRPAEYYNNSWRGTLDEDGGILFTQFSHFIDLLYWFLGEVETVSGWRSNFNHQQIIDFEDTGVANMIMKSGAIGTLHYTINAHDTNMEGSFTLFGDKGTIKIGGRYLDRIEYFSVANESIPGSLKTGMSDPKSNHLKVYEELVRSMEHQESAMVGAEEALKSIEIIRKIYDASPFISGNAPF